MKLFITYFTCDEYNYDLWDIHTSRTDAVNTFKAKHVPFFIEGHQPETSGLVLVEAEVSPADYNYLKSLNTSNTNASDELTDILSEVEEDFLTDWIYSIDGYINYEFAVFYGTLKGLDSDEVEEDPSLELEELSELEDTNPAKYKSLLSDFLSDYFD